MPESSEVAGGDTTLATQFNDLRKDVLDKDVGHTHSGEVDGGAAVGSPLIPKASQFLGDGSDGALVVSAPTVFEGVKNFTDLTINSGGIITPASGKHFLFIFVSGTLTINSGGIIDVEGFGGAPPPPGVAANDGFSSELNNLPDENEGGAATGVDGLKSGAHKAAICDAGDDLFVAFGASGGSSSGIGALPGGNNWSGGGGAIGSVIATGGAGGGCVVIFANIVIVNAGGIIRANGTVGVNQGTGNEAGSGGGGLIYIAARTFTNNGTIEVVSPAPIGGFAGRGANGLFVEKKIPG